MKKDIVLFYKPSYNPTIFFKIKNAALRNISNSVKYFPLESDIAWIEFLRSFISSNKINLLLNNMTLKDDYQGFILTYRDAEGKTNIILDLDSILEFLKS